MIGLSKGVERIARHPHLKPSHKPSRCGIGYEGGKVRKQMVRLVTDFKIPFPAEDSTETGHTKTSLTPSLVLLHGITGIGPAGNAFMVFDHVRVTKTSQLSA